MLQLVQSPNASSLNSTQVLLAGTSYAADAAAGAVSNGQNAIFDASRICNSSCAAKLRPVLEKSKRNITRPDDTRVSTRRCNAVPITIHDNTQLKSVQ